MTTATKSKAIEAAATTIIRLHPNKKDPYNHKQILQATFEFVCLEVAEDDPISASKNILDFVKRSLA